MVFGLDLAIRLGLWVSPSGRLPAPHCNMVSLVVKTVDVLPHHALPALLQHVFKPTSTLLGT